MGQRDTIHQAATNAEKCDACQGHEVPGKNHEIETGKKCLFFVFTANPLPPRNEDADLKNDGFLPVSIS